MEHQSDGQPGVFEDYRASTLETATFGMGCFWGPDARFGALPGVVRTRAGYAGGSKPDPSYYALGDHTEVLQLEYDPETIDYGELLEIVWDNHNWTTQSRKRQYRGVIFAHTDAQLEAAKASRDALEERTGRTAETDIESLEPEEFTLAEDYHQKYELRSTPIVGDELEAVYGKAFVDSTTVARLNGFVAGHGDLTQRREVLATVEISPMAIAELERRL